MRNPLNQSHFLFISCSYTRGGPMHVHLTLISIFFSWLLPRHLLFIFALPKPEQSVFTLYYFNIFVSIKAL